MSSSEEKDLLQQITYLSRLIKRHKTAARPSPLPNTGTSDPYHLVRNDKTLASAQPSCSYTYVRPDVTSINHHSQSFTRLNNQTQYIRKTLDQNLVKKVNPASSNVVNSKPSTILINPNFKKTDKIASTTSPLINNSSSSTVSDIGKSKTILLNPNFKGSSVHINTNFFSSLEVSAKQQVCKDVSTNVSSVSDYSIPSTSSENYNKPVKQYSLKTNRKLVRNNTKTISDILKPNNTSTTTTVRSPLISINKRKLVRMSAKTDKVISDIKVHRTPYKKVVNIAYKKKTKLDKCSLFFNKVPTKNVFNKSQGSVKSSVTASGSSKYKFIRGSKMSKSPSTSKFRLDHRTRVKNVKKYSLKYENNSTPLKKSWHNATLSPRLRAIAAAKAYRYRKNSASSQGPKLSEFSIGGQKYVMDSTGKTLKRLAAEPNSSNAGNKQSVISLLKRIHVAGMTYKAKAPNVYVRTNDHKTRTIVSQAKYKSISVLVNKMRKNNQPCVFYHRFGKCIRKEKGTCPCVHDPKQIAICKKFLLGKCEVKGCLLSHDVRPEKMPTCQYFLDGCCVRDPCPYLHVKVNAHAEVCHDFLNGYCASGNMCKKKHINICPDFDKNGKCSKGKFCPYPHKPTQKKSHFVRSKKVKVTENKEKEEEGSLTVENARYYQKDEPIISDDQTLPVESITSELKETESEDIIKPRPRKRPKLGVLPSFIPI